MRSKEEGKPTNNRQHHTHTRTRRKKKKTARVCGDGLDHQNMSSTNRKITQNQRMQKKILGLLPSSQCKSSAGIPPTPGYRFTGSGNGMTRDPGRCIRPFPPHPGPGPREKSLSLSALFPSKEKTKRKTLLATGTTPEGSRTAPSSQGG